MSSIPSSVTLKTEGLGMNIIVGTADIHCTCPGKKYPETGGFRIYGKESERIANSPPVFPDTSYLGQVPATQQTSHSKPLNHKNKSCLSI